MLIDNNLETLTKKNEEERTKYDYEFQLFLIRRRCYCLIELKLYDQAVEGLKYLLSIDPENQFAKQEMEYINSINNNK